MGAATTNWAGNIVFGAARIHRPSTVAELQAVVAAAERVRPLGTGHSFNRIADTDGDLVSVAGLPATIEIDSDAGRVRCAAGLPYGTLAARLHAAGWALPNLGSLPHISVAGACATGTHGSGDRNGVLATAVSALELVTAGGDVVELRRDRLDDRLAGAVVGLGALGVVTSVVLDLVPTYDVLQHVYEDLPLQVLDDSLDEVLGAGYSVSLFTDWQGPVVDQVWLRRRVEDDEGSQPGEEWLGSRLAREPRHPIHGMSPANATEQLGIPGPWHERLPGFRLDAVPSAGAELQSEYFVARADGHAALRAVAGVRDALRPALQVSEVRSVAADELWLSPAQGRETLAIHFTWVRDERIVRPAVAAVEAALAPLRVRPHWGKVFGMAPEDVAARYDRLPDFRRLAADLDPRGVFTNPFLASHLGPGPSPARRPEQGPSAVLGNRAAPD